MTDLPAVTWLLGLSVIATPGTPQSPRALQGLDALAADRSLIPSPEVERARALRAQAGEAETALRGVGGVQDARVVIGDSAISVVVRHDPGPAPLTVQSVRSLVTTALPPDLPGPVNVLLSAAPPRAPARPPARPPQGLLLAVGALCAGLGAWVITRSVARRPPPD